MRKLKPCVTLSLLCLFSWVLSACSSSHYSTSHRQLPPGQYVPYNSAIYTSRLPQRIDTHGEKVILVDPKVHAWGAYSADGNLVKGGLASAGANWCPDLGRPCHTRSGSFRINSLGSPNCKSTLFPIPKGGAPMPYCMFFNGGQGLHGSHAREVVDGNVSHGCVRMHVQDAEWVRYNFANVGTRVIVESY